MSVTNLQLQLLRKSRTIHPFCSVRARHRRMQQKWSSAAPPCSLHKLNYSRSRLQFRGCWRACSQDFWGRSARNPQEKIVAQISRGARRDRDPHRPQPLSPLLPRPAQRTAYSAPSCGHRSEQQSTSDSKSREPSHSSSSSSTHPACSLPFRSPARSPGNRSTEKLVVVAAAEREAGGRR